MGRRVRGKDKREERLKNYKPRNRQDNIILVLLKKKRGRKRERKRAMKKIQTVNSSVRVDKKVSTHNERWTAVATVCVSHPFLPFSPPPKSWQESGVEVKTEAAAGNSVETRASKGHSGKIHGLLHPSPFFLSLFLSLCPSLFRFFSPRERKNK